MTQEIVRCAFAEAADNFTKLCDVAPIVAAAADVVTASLRAGGKVLLCGNGGSAADAQHIAAELMGRFMLERAALPAVALNTNASTMTAIANDYSYDEVFARQVRGLGRAGDVIIGISTSGNSVNVLKALETAAEQDMVAIALTGESGGRMAALCQVCIKVPSNSTPRIQEMHIAVGHILCELVESALA